jgi:hypothetical protein
MACEWLSTIPTQRRYDIATFERNRHRAGFFLPVTSYCLRFDAADLF